MHVEKVNKERNFPEYIPCTYVSLCVVMYECVIPIHIYWNNLINGFHKTYPMNHTFRTDT